MDNRSFGECLPLRETFDIGKYYPVTGQVSILATRPATKLLHLRRHGPDVFERTEKSLLIEDQIIYRLTGMLAGEQSAYNFSFYFDVRKRQYWQEMLDYCGARTDQLPEVVESGAVVGPLKAEIAPYVGLPAGSTVNAGTLDQFASMIGTGNVMPGMVSECTRAVMTVATLVSSENHFDGLPFHIGPFRGCYVLRAVCESGGKCYEWFRNSSLSEMTFEEINRHIAQRNVPNDLIFLPGIAGVNAPDFDSDACGLFCGLHAEHDRIEMVCTLLEGIARLLTDNIEFFQNAGLPIYTIHSTGSSSRSRLWCQLKADISGHEAAVPETSEAACLGAAAIGAVSCGRYASYAEAIRERASVVKLYRPNASEIADRKPALYKAGSQGFQSVRDVSQPA